MDSRCVKESGGKTTISFTFCDLKTEPNFQKSAKTANGGKMTIEGSRQPKTHQKVTPKSQKKKSPSRRRRDKARFHAFLERKRLSKARKAHSAQPPEEKPCNPPQVVPIIPSARIVTPAPDPEVLPTSPPELPPSPHSDSWITDSEGESPLVDISPEPVPKALSDLESQPNTSPTNAQPTVGSPCNCLACSCPVEPFELADLYEECSVCFLSAEEAPNGLKPCARCLSSVYCSKKCQIQDWKEHKQMCTEEIGVRVRKAREEILQRKNRALELQRTQLRCLHASAT